MNKRIYKLKLASKLFKKKFKFQIKDAFKGFSLN